MITWRRCGYAFRLEYFRNITNKNDEEFKLRLRDMSVSKPSWHPNPVVRERDNFRNLRKISAISWKYR